mmetsp:Transcript_17801/g.43578  ORF Transcript_17801/g.43578 Transcript_17801/m.43578 type:complete len:236 (+) Transcript_17801:1322-2029(+)
MMALQMGMVSLRWPLAALSDPPRHSISVILPMGFFGCGLSVGSLLSSPPFFVSVLILKGTYVSFDSYMRSRTSLYILATTERFNFSVLVSSPVSTEKSLGKIVNFWMLDERDGLISPLLLVASIALQISSMYPLDSTAWEILVIPSTKFEAVKSNSSPPGSNPVESCDLSVIKHTLNFFLSPNIMMLDTSSHSFFTLSSIGTGATFSPPAPIMISLYRPVIISIPFLPMLPLSPE